MAEPELTEQTVILVSGGPSGPLPLAVSDKLDTVIERVRQAARERGGVTFRQPQGEGKVYVADARSIVAAFTQMVQMINDPRAAGVFRTGSGIELPR